MRRIGIASRVHGINYGANLQAVALQKVIEELGTEVEYIDFEVTTSSVGFKRILSWGFGIIRLFLGYQIRLKRTNAFRLNYLHFSPHFSEIHELSAQVGRYDLLLAGSDQIWNPRYYRQSCGLYLLTFSNEISKASYASSFGIISLSDRLQSIYAEQLQKFKFLSVREKSGLEILKKMGLNAEVNLDPTLLLNEKQWKALFNISTPIISGEYICCYVMSGADKLNQYVIYQAELLQKQIGNIKVVVLGEKEYKGFFSSHIYIRTAGPIEFLNYIAHAKYVLTSSFHGTCFSVIFKKDFFSILSKENKFNSRIEDLLILLALQHRIYYCEERKTIVNETLHCDYSIAVYLLEKERNKSLKYLTSLIRSL